MELIAKIAAALNMLDEAAELFCKLEGVKSLKEYADRSNEGFPLEHDTIYARLENHLKKLETYQTLEKMLDSNK